MEYIKIISSGILLGLSSGLYCLGACAPILVPYLLSEDRGKVKGNLKVLAEYSFGRLIAYLIFGFIVGMIGQKAQSPLEKLLIGIAIITSAALILIYGFIKNFPMLDVCKLLGERISHRKIPWVFGFLTGINICPPFIMAITYTLELGGVWKAVVSFFAFFIGTTIYLIPLTFTGYLVKFEKVRVAAQIASVIAGVWFLFYGISVLVNLR